MNKFYFSAVIFIVIFAVGLYGQASQSQVKADDSTSLSQQPTPVGEVTVSSLRINRKIRELPTSISVVGAYDYQRQSALTLSNVLQAEPGIAMGSDGVWATNVNIRGLSENRLVTLIDGNRVETATDLTASFSMVDVHDIDRVEVIKGAQSSLYGTGAMGGIVNIITRDGRFADKPYIAGNFTSGFASVNKLFTEYAAINAGAGKWYLRLSGTYNKTDDISTPDGELPNSQYTSSNMALKTGFRPKDNHLFKLQYQHNWSVNVGIPGGEAFAGPAEATYTNIGRHLVAASYEITNLTSRLASLKLSYFTQYIVRDVAMNPNTVTETHLPNGNLQRTTPTLVTPVGEHLTNGIQLQSTWNFTSKNTLVTGVDVWARRLTTERTKYITVQVTNPQGTILATNQLERGETPIPESIFGSAGLFMQDEARFFNEKLTLIMGGRLDGIYIENKQGYDVDYLIVNGTRNDSPSNQRITYTQDSENSLSWSANAGMLYKLSGHTDLSVNLARSFRAPSLEERFKYIDLGNYVRLGDPNLEPESGYNADLGFRIWKPGLTFQAGAFINRLTNLIVESPGIFIYTLNTGTNETITDTLPAFVNTNISKALLYGIDYEMQVALTSRLTLLHTASFVRGKDTEAGTNLPRIPPINGRLGIRYTHAGIGSAELTLVGAAKQDKTAESEKETDGYTRLDLMIHSDYLRLGSIKLQLFAGIDNMTNKRYTNHLSTNRGNISFEPGRNLFIRLNLRF
jgi:hemoglobin/transferrin/lactoferrin receptor protein